MEDNTEDNPFSSIGNSSLNQASFGKLVKSRFYGMPQNVKIYHCSIKISLLIFSILLFVGGIVSLFSGKNIGDYIISVLFLFVGVASGYTLIIYIRQETKSSNFLSTFFTGDLDWDLYENGVSGRKIKSYIPYRIETKFLYFNDISKVYFTVNDANAIDLRNLINAGNKQFVEQGKKNWSESELKWDDEDIKSVKRGIWFVDNKNNILPFVLSKEWIKDLVLFESIIRQKVKNVL